MNRPAAGEGLVQRPGHRPDSGCPLKFKAPTRHLLVAAFEPLEDSGCPLKFKAPAAELDNWASGRPNVMLSLQALIETPPEGLDRFAPYPAVTAPRGKLVDGVLDRHLRSTCQEPAELRAAVLVGRHIGALTQHVVGRLPHLERVLLVEPDLRLLRTLQQSPPAVAGVTRNDIYIADAVGPQAPYSADTYLETCRFLLEADTSIDDTLVLCEPEVVASSELHAAVARALHDLAFDFSSALLSVAHDDILGDALFRRWADWLCERGEAYHALKFYLRHWRRLPRPEVAHQVINAWSRVGCVAEVRRWLPLTGCTPDQAAAIVAEAMQRAGPGRDELLQGLDGTIQVMVPSSLPNARAKARVRRVTVANGFIVDAAPDSDLGFASSA